MPAGAAGPDLARVEQLDEGPRCSVLLEPAPVVLRSGKFASTIDILDSLKLI